MYINHVNWPSLVSSNMVLISQKVSRGGPQWLWPSSSSHKRITKKNKNCLAETLWKETSEPWSAVNFHARFWGYESRSPHGIKTIAVSNHDDQACPSLLRFLRIGYAITRWFPFYCNFMIFFMGIPYHQDHFWCIPKSYCWLRPPWSRHSAWLNPDPNIIVLLTYPQYIVLLTYPQYIFMTSPYWLVINYKPQLYPIWMFPEMRVPLVIIHFHRLSRLETNHFMAYPHFWKPP